MAGTQTSCGFPPTELLYKKRELQNTYINENKV